MGPGFKDSEVGRIPNDWDVHNLGSLVDRERSIRYGIVQPGKYDPNGRLLIRGQDYSRGWDDASSMFRVSDRVEQRYRNARVLSGDLIITIVGASTGEVAKVPDWLDGANLTQTTARVAVDPEKANTDFVYQALRSQVGVKNVDNYIKGGAQPGLNCGDVEKFILAIPNRRDEQDAIADALSDADALVEGLKRLIAKKRLIKQGAMQDLLTAKRRLPGFSGEWVRFKAGDFLNFKNGLNKAKKFFGHGTPIVNYMDVFKGGRIDATSIAGLVEVTTAEQSAYGVEDGDILFTRTSETPEEIGLAAVADGLLDGTVVSGFVLRGRPQNEKLTRAYSRYCFRSDAVRRQIISRATYTTRALTNGRQLSQVEVFAPEEPDEQDAIADVLQDLEAEIQALQTRLKKARAVKEGMMQNLLTGWIRLV